MCQLTEWMTERLTEWQLQRCLSPSPSFSRSLCLSLSPLVCLPVGHVSSWWSSGGSAGNFVMAVSVFIYPAPTATPTVTLAASPRPSWLPPSPIPPAVPFASASACCILNAFSFSFYFIALVLTSPNCQRLPQLVLCLVCSPFLLLSAHLSLSLAICCMACLVFAYFHLFTCVSFG